MKRWDRALEGTSCSCCSGTGSSFEHGDAHRSAGTIPCPWGLFKGHGYPTCFNGVLQFSDYDKKHWNKLKKEFPQPKPQKVVYPRIELPGLRAFRTARSSGG